MRIFIKVLISVTILFCSGELICNLVFAANVTVTAEPSSGVAPLEVKLICNVAKSTERPTTYKIDFGDGSSEGPVESDQYSHTFTHTYEAGFFKAKCQIQKKMGLSTDSDPTSIIVAKWKYQTDGDVDSSPAIGPDGTVYVGSDDGYLHAIDPETGDGIWRFETGGAIQSSPAVDGNGTIYFGSLDKNFYAVKPNGDLKWSFPIGDYIFSSPAIGPDGRIIYIGASDNHLYAFNAGGTLKWKFPAEDKIVSAPSIGHDGIEHVVYFGSLDRNVYAVAADNGELKWKFKTDAEVTASPAVGRNGRIYVGEVMLGTAEEYNFKFYCLNIDGTKHWAYAEVTGFYSSPAIDPDGAVYVGSWEGALTALGSNGVRKWVVRPGPPYASINSSPAVGANGVIYVGSKKGKFYALQSPADKSDDPQNWIFSTGDDIAYSSPVIDDGGTIYFGARDNYVYAINPGNLAPANSPWPMYRGNAAHTGLKDAITLSDVMSTEPGVESTEVKRDISLVKIHFSPEIDDNKIDINEFSLKLKTKEGTEAVEGSADLKSTEYNNSGYRPTAIFKRLDKTPLPYNSTYTASIIYTPAVSETAEEEPGPQTFSFSFTTEEKPEDEPDPDPKGDFGCFIDALVGRLTR